MEFEVIVGSYEHFLIGYTVKQEMNEESGKLEYTSKQSFTNNSHGGKITAVTTMGKYLVSGSSDEIIRIINLEGRVEHGSLQQQEGTITCLASFEQDFIFSGSEDGTICIWKSGSWLCEKTLRGHQGGIVGISIHPSGKLALSIGKDRSLKTWNLIKGRSGFITNLKGVADYVKWSPSGIYYAVSIANRVDIYSLETAKVIYSIPFGKRANSLVFLNDDVIILAGDKDAVEIYSIDEKKQLTSFDAHKNRVRDIAVIPENNLLLTASNDGLIKIWTLNEEDFSSQPTLVKEIDSTCRITCMTVHVKGTIPKQAKKGKTQKSKPENFMVQSKDAEPAPKKRKHTSTGS